MQMITHNTHKTCFFLNSFFLYQAVAPRVILKA